MIEILLVLRILKEFVNLDKSESIKEVFIIGVDNKNLSSLDLNF